MPPATTSVPAPIASAAPMPPPTAPVPAPIAAQSRRLPPAAAAKSPTPAPTSPAPPPADSSGAKRVARRPGKESQELRELAAAFARGAGLDTEVEPLTPEWMEHLGALLRATAEGTLALLQSRAVAKRHMRAEGTHIAPRQNNP